MKRFKYKSQVMLFAPLCITFLGILDIRIFAHSSPLLMWACVALMAIAWIFGLSGIGYKRTVLFNIVFNILGILLLYAMNFGVMFIIGILAISVSFALLMAISGKKEDHSTIVIDMKR